MTREPRPPTDDSSRSLPLDEAVRRFEATFARAPMWAASAPGRVNLIGGHTDYNGGLVLPVAIDRRVVVVAAPSAGRTTIDAADLGETVEVDLRGQESPLGRPHWANAVLGVAAEFARRGLELVEVDLTIRSSVPIGAGLASSAAVEVATATLFEEIVGERLDAAEKAELCRRAEHEFVGTPCGIMDMLISAAARPGTALLIDCDVGGRVRPITLPPPDQMGLLVVDTGIRHELAISAYADRRTTCETVARRLGRRCLRLASRPDLDAASLTEIERRRATHVLDEIDRTRRAAELLDAGDLVEAGALMFGSHASLRDLYDVSCPELDTVVAAADECRGEGGVLGARMTGGGFGGSAIVLCRPGATRSIRSHLARAYERRHGRTAHLLPVKVAGGAARHQVR